jgi:hypothetical protein
MASIWGSLGLQQPELRARSAFLGVRHGSRRPSEGGACREANQNDGVIALASQGATVPRADGYGQSRLDAGAGPRWRSAATKVTKSEPLASGQGRNLACRTGPAKPPICTLLRMHGEQTGSIGGRQEASIEATKTADWETSYFGGR